LQYCRKNCFFLLNDHPLSAAPNSSVLDRAEALREVGSVFQSFELRLGVRIVIRDVRAAVGLGDIEIDEQRGDALGSHAGAAIGMERESPEPTAEDGSTPAENCSFPSGGF
jgi:hypothetical protein